MLHAGPVSCYGDRMLNFSILMLVEMCFWTVHCQTSGCYSLLHVHSSWTLCWWPESEDSTFCKYSTLRLFNLWECCFVPSKSAWSPSFFTFTIIMRIASSSSLLRWLRGFQFEDRPFMPIINNGLLWEQGTASSTPNTTPQGSSAPQYPKLSTGAIVMLLFVCYLTLFTQNS